MNATSEATRSKQARHRSNPWVQLSSASLSGDERHLQYAGGRFLSADCAKYHWVRASIQVAFTISCALKPWLVPIECRSSTRLHVERTRASLIGGALCGIACRSIR